MATERKEQEVELAASAPDEINHDFREEYVDLVKESDNLLCLKKGESLVGGLRRLDKDLVSNYPGTTGCCTRYTILDGQLGCATMYGRTHFLPPGNYFRIGIGCDLVTKKDIDSSSKSGSLLQWKDVTYVSLPENHIAVVQEGDKQSLLGSGRYILRQPVTLYGVVDVQNLNNKESVDAITEEAGNVKDHNGVVEDKQRVVHLQAGEWQKVGAVTFLRACPGFCFVVQDVAGRLRSGVGFSVARGGEVFKRFVDRQHYARTTRQFHLESKDRQEVLVRVQLRWRLEDAKLWLTRQGASQDVFDAIEEIAQSLLRDAIAANTYEDCRLQAGEGYEGIEARIRGPLEDETAALGGVLLGFEIRTLRFPLLEQRNKERANAEAILKEKVMQEKRHMEIEQEQHLRSTAKMEYNRGEEAKKLSHDAKMELLRNEERLVKQRAADDLKKTREEAGWQLQKAHLSAQKEQEIIQQQLMIEKEKAEAQRVMIKKEASAMERVKDAEADARATLAKSEAEAQAKIKIAEADAKAAELIGAAYRANPEFVALEQARIQAEVMKVRANAISVAMANNSGAMMPVDIQRELAIMGAGFNPTPAVMMPNGLSLVSGGSKKGRAPVGGNDNEE